jgi:GGDEF domain-containing protein
LVNEIYRFLESNPDKVIKNLKFSYGYSEYKKGYTLDQLYAKVDKEMYENKSE